jgi:hypothetical protein
MMEGGKGARLEKSNGEKLSFAVVTREGVEEMGGRNSSFKV